jgi:hypothetical protein
MAIWKIDYYPIEWHKAFATLKSNESSVHTAAPFKRSRPCSSPCNVFPAKSTSFNVPDKTTLSQCWQVRPQDFTTSQLTALYYYIVNSKKLASIVMRKYVKSPKWRYSGTEKMHVRIVQQFDHVQINSVQNLKNGRCREGCFLEPPFLNKFPWYIDK